VFIYRKSSRQKIGSPFIASGFTLHDSLGLGPTEIGKRRGNVCLYAGPFIKLESFYHKWVVARQSKVPATRLPPGLMSLVCFCCCLSYSTSLKPASQHVPIIHHQPSSSGNLWKLLDCSPDRLSPLCSLWGYLTPYMGVDNNRSYAMS